MNINSIIEAFDNLPTGVCFFRKNGILTLCNLKMSQLAFEVTGRDLQNLSELQAALDEPHEGVIKDGSEYILPDGTAWFFAGKVITDRYGDCYVQITASDVTELHAKRHRLAEENEQLIKIRNSLRQLSANVAAETREKEILSMKMHVHDDIGSSMIAAHQILKQRKPMTDADDVVATWERAIDLLRRTNDEKPEKDELSQLRDLSMGMGLEIVLTGEMPRDDEMSYLVVTAIRECVTNAVSYAEAKHLNVRVETAHDGMTLVTIENDGKPPADDVVEGGGLSMLRRRIEYAGGSMKVVSSPVFRLIVSLPEA